MFSPKWDIYILPLRLRGQQGREERKTIIAEAGKDINKVHHDSFTDSRPLRSPAQIGPDNMPSLGSQALLKALVVNACWGRGVIFFTVVATAKSPTSQWTAPCPHPQLNSAGYTQKTDKKAGGDSLARKRVSEGEEGLVERGEWGIMKTIKINYNSIGNFWKTKNI